MSTEPILESIADLWSADCLMFRTKLTQDPLPRSRRRCYRSLQVVVSPWCRHLPLCSPCLASHPAPPGGDAHTLHALLPAGPAADFVALNPQVTSLFASFSLALHELLPRGLLWLGGCGGGTLWRMHFATLVQSLLRDLFRLLLLRLLCSYSGVFRKITARYFPTASGSWKLNSSHHGR